jgi:hypothetical protein
MDAPMAGAAEDLNCGLASSGILCKIGHLDLILSCPFTSSVNLKDQ